MARCGEAFTRGQHCSCDLQCASHNECCHDFAAVCTAGRLHAKFTFVLMAIKLSLIVVARTSQSFTRFKQLCEYFLLSQLSPAGGAVVSRSDVDGCATVTLSASSSTPVVMTTGCSVVWASFSNILITYYKFSLLL